MNFLQTKKQIICFLIFCTMHLKAVKTSVEIKTQVSYLQKLQKALVSCQELSCRSLEKTKALPLFDSFLDFSCFEKDLDADFFQSNSDLSERTLLKDKRKEIIRDIQMALESRFVLLQEKLSEYAEVEKSLNFSITSIINHTLFTADLRNKENLLITYQKLKELRQQIKSLVMDFPKIKKKKCYNSLEAIISHHKECLRLELKYLSKFKEVACDHLFSLHNYFEELKNKNSKIFAKHSVVLYKAYSQTVRVAFTPEQNYRSFLQLFGIPLVTRTTERENKENIVAHSQNKRGVRGTIVRGLLRRKEVAFSTSSKNPEPPANVSDYLEIMKDPLGWSLYFTKNNTKNVFDKVSLLKTVLDQMSIHQDGKSDATCQKSLLNLTKLIFHSSSIYQKPNIARKIYNTYSVFAREKKCLAEFAGTVSKHLRNARIL